MSGVGILSGTAVIIIVLLILWIWMNVRFVKSQGSKSDRTSAEPVRNETSRTAEHTANNPEPTEKFTSASPVNPGDTEKDMTFHEDTERISDNAAEHEVTNVEVYDVRSDGSSTVFGRENLPYYLRTTVDSPFRKEWFGQVFTALSQDKNILGWLAFYDEKVGASDHPYEDTFIETLVNYKASVEQLQKEVGLSRIHETAVHGDKGEVWIVPGAEDTWYVLFLDEHANARELVDEVIQPMRLNESNV